MWVRGRVTAVAMSLGSSLPRLHASLGLSAPLPTPRTSERAQKRRATAKASTLVATSVAEVVRRSVSHAGFLAYQQHLTGVAAAYHTLATLPPLVLVAALLTISASIYEFANQFYQLLLATKPQQTVKEEPYTLHGVDLSKSRYFLRESVRQAVAFAAEAHKDQTRLTGEPYVVHCIETALIVEFNLPEVDDDERHEAAVVAAVLHDTMDDAYIDEETLTAAFGERVASMVVKVSKLSGANQLLRRRKREGLLSLSEQEERKLRRELKRMILDMVVEEPLVILIKLADRLHNMRTCYALRQDKQRAVAEETMEVWCSMAERMGWDALKSEMEDLCFAGMEPERYRELRSGLDALWGLPPMEGLRPAAAQPPEGAPGGGGPAVLEQYLWAAASKVATTGAAVLAMPSAGAELGLQQAQTRQLTAQQQELRALLATVVPFDVARFSHQMRVPRVAAGMRVLDAAAEELLYRIRVGSYSAGLSIVVQGRLKSLNSIRKKMGAKALSLSEVYDARGLRIIVDDGGGASELDAIYVCYRMAQTVIGLWKRIKGQYDDYIANPKPSGYRALHLAVKGPDGRPMEVQIKTSSMHFHAEYGGAAHWAYKEGVPLPSLVQTGPGADVGPYVGQPVVQVDFSDHFGRFRYGVVVDVGYEGHPHHLLVALRTAGTVKEHPFWMPNDFYTLLLAHARDNFLSKGRNRPSDGDLLVRLDEYALCKDGRYHRVDMFGVIQTHTTVNLRRMTALDVQPEWYASAQHHLTGSSHKGGAHPSGSAEQAHGADVDAEKDSQARHSMEIFQKTRLVRSMIEGLDELQASSRAATEALQNDEVSVLLWPEGCIAHFPKGTTAGAVVRERGRIDIAPGEDAPADPSRSQGAPADRTGRNPGDSSVGSSMPLAYSIDKEGAASRRQAAAGIPLLDATMGGSEGGSTSPVGTGSGGTGSSGSSSNVSSSSGTSSGSASSSGSSREYGSSALSSLDEALAAELRDVVANVPKDRPVNLPERSKRVPWESTVNVNNRLVHESTPLEDGDLVILSREILKI